MYFSLHLNNVKDFLFKKEPFEFEIYLLLQIEKDSPLNDGNSHIANIGRLVEDMENKMRNTLNEIYFGKTMDIVNDLR